MTIKISIDCMGGDFGPSVTVAAAVSFANREPDVEFVLVGQETVLQAELKKLGAISHPRLSIVHASEMVEMDDPIEIALRRKKDSSMRVALNQVKEGLAQACVSAGNTGALMAVSRYVLKTMPGVDRPAICSILPNQKKLPTYMLDLGANVDCEPLHLHQFAIMGSALVAALENKPRPTVGLLESYGAHAARGTFPLILTAAVASGVGVSRRTRRVVATVRSRGALEDAVRVPLITRYAVATLRLGRRRHVSGATVARVAAP